MREATLTRTGTLLIEDIEFNESPPACLIRATESEWATRLRDEGMIRLNSVEHYRQVESSELGDRHEGRGIFHMDGHLYTTDSHNEVYIWCCALPDTSVDILKCLSPTYDCIIAITDPIMFTKRICTHLNNLGVVFSPHLGEVEYTRGAEVSKRVLNSQKFSYNIFQKGAAHAHQAEYRLSFANASFRSLGLPHLDLVMGNCNDVVKIAT